VVGRLREWFAWVLLAGFGLLAGGLVIEVAVRTLHLVPDRFWEPHPRLGWRLVAGREGWWTQEDREFRVPIRINSRGLRDLDRPYEKPPGIRRVLLLGDSFIEALQVPLEQTLARRLESRLGSSVEVINAGVSSYGTASQLMFLREEGLRYDPDLVLLAFYAGNDVKNNSPTLEDVLTPVYDEKGELIRVQAPSIGNGSRPRGWRESLESYRYARELLLRSRLGGELRVLGLVPSAGPRVTPERDGIPTDYYVYAPEPDAEWASAWEHTERLLARMRSEVEAAGRAFAAVVVPSRYEIYPEWWQETIAARPAMASRRWDVPGPGQRIARWCEIRSVACLDLSTGLRAEAGERERLYFHHDGHWTARGHDVVARLIAGFIQRFIFVPSKEKTV
jgi:hypothetical protein